MSNVMSCDIIREVKMKWFKKKPKRKADDPMNLQIFHDAEKSYESYRLKRAMAKLEKVILNKKWEVIQ